MSRSSLGALALVLAAAALAACNPRRGEPLTGAVPVDEEPVERGRTVFMKDCYQCHPGGEAGVGPALNDKPFPGFVTRLRVRHPLGAMPAFSKRELSDAQLKDLIAYLAALRRYDARRDATVESRP